MDEYKLSEAELSVDGFRIAFKKRSRVAATVHTGETLPPIEEIFEAPLPAIIEPEVSGTPVNSPMTGIFYSSPNPSSPPFVKEGDEVIAGQTIGLIEAMKVFNEVPCPTSGRIARLIVDSGQLVNLGDPLLYIAN